MSYTSTPLNRLVLKRVRRELANDSMLSNTYMARCLPCSPLVPFLDVGGDVSVPHCSVSRHVAPLLQTVHSQLVCGFFCDPLPIRR